MLGYKLYNELRIEVERKKAEKRKTTEEFISSLMSQKEYQIKTFMLNEQINLLNNLAEKEFDRLEHLKRKGKRDTQRFYRWAIMTDGKEGSQEIGNLGWFTGDCDEAYILEYCKEKGIKIVKNEIYREWVEIVGTD